MRNDHPLYVGRRVPAYHIRPSDGHLLCSATLFGRQEVTNVKDKRLNNADRDALIAFARKKVAETGVPDGFDEAYASAALVISNAVAAQFPPKEMAILKKYDAAFQDECIHYAGSGAQYGEFNFRRGDPNAPFRPGRGCNRRTPVRLDEAQTEAVVSYQSLFDATKAKNDQRFNDFKAAIHTATKFSDLAAIWPAVEEMHLRIVGTNSSLVVMNDDVLERIANDPASRLAA